MKNLSCLLLVFLLLNVGCRKEAIVAEGSSTANVSALNKVTNLQKVTTVDGSITQISSTVEKMKSGEITLISKPANWNGDLILYAHGYVSSFLPLALPTEADAYVPLFTSMGYAFATTSYSENGLAIQSGIGNIIELRKKFIKEYGQPKHIYLAGGSEGGVVTTLAVERNPDLFSGGLPLCGPCGDFQKQINYYGDCRVLFDYFFPGVLPGNVINIPDELIIHWQDKYYYNILGAIASNPVATSKLLNIILNPAQASYIIGNPQNVAKTIVGLLWYDVFATRDAVAKLKGQPYNNVNKIYSGTGSSDEDALLNKLVQRFSADKKALKDIEKYYETTGNISVPLVSAHTIGDPLIPIWHLQLYNAKIAAQDRSTLFTGYPVDAFGHCNFTELQIAQAFGALVQKVQGQVPTQTQKLVNFSSATDGKVVRSVQ
jgi:pimeloyl-ACP methyl ester carboxylesterase